MPITEVSVITAAYNSAGLIERNIRSVGAQSLQPREHIIVDDGSDDDTAAIVQGLAGEFPHLRLLREAHGGAAKARNAGILAASGRFVAFLDSDDLWSEGKLEAQIGFMTANDVAFSYGDYDVVDAGTGAWLGRCAGPDRVSHDDLLRGCPIGCLTVAFDQYRLGKRFMPDVRRGQDWGFWLALTRDGAIARRYPGCHAVYRQSSASLSSAKLAKVADIYGIYRRQEGLGRLRSLRYLGPHILAALRKRPALDRGTGSRR
jgi:teichuronic acid biosynthesis glycosyltransferase TuaG